MRPPRSIVGRIANAPLLRNTAMRRGIFIVLVVLCAILSFFPQKYRAAVSLTPVDPSSLGLSGQMQFGAIGGLLNNQSSLEVSLTVARSEYVRETVAKQLNVARRFGKSEIGAQRWLDREVDIGSLRGGILQFETKQRDPIFARELVAAYADATRRQLAIVGRDQTAQKRQIVLDLINESSNNLAQAQAAYDTFRLETRYSSPQAAIYAAGDRIPVLEALIRSKQVELAAAHQFANDSEPRIRQMTATIDALKRQLDDARSISPGENSSVGQVVRQSTELEKLRRNLSLAQTMYESYKRYLQNTSAENMTAVANVRILEPAYVDSARQINMIPASLGIVVFLLGVAIEAYLIRPPVGEKAAA